MANVLTTTQPVGSQTQVTRLDGGSLDIAIADEAALPPGPVAPFKATYYVDQTFGGTQLGSQSNPFTSVAAAWAAALTLSLTSAVVHLPPGAVHTENVVFPAIGGQWEIACEVPYLTSTVGCQLVGTVTANNPTAGVASFRLQGLIVTGAIAGLATGTTALFLEDTRCLSTVTLTTGAGGPWQLQCIGRGVCDPNHTSGNIAGAVTVQGRILATNYSLEAPLSMAPQTDRSQFWNCRLTAAACASIALAGAAGTSTRFLDCVFEGPLTFTATNASSVVWDGVSMASALRFGVNYAGAPITSTTDNGQRSVTQVITTNVAAANVTAAPAPAGLYEAVASEEVLAATGTGAAVVNVIYTNLAGVLTTTPVTPALNVAAAAGTESVGTLAFQHDGASAIQFSVTGFVTPGSVQVAIAVARRD